MTTRERTMAAAVWAHCSTLAVMVCGALIAAIPAAQAHHAFAAAYDMNKPIKHAGKITKVDWINPHSLIHFDVKGADGKVVNWTAEAGTPNALIRMGLTKQSFGPGVDIVVSGFTARDGSNKMSAREVTTPDGKPLFQGGDR